MAKRNGGCQHFCTTCLLGLFGCHWTHKKSLKTSKCDSAWFFLLFCIGLLALAWLYVALVTLNDFHNFNEFIFQKTEWWLDWSVVMLCVTATLVTYSSLLMVGLLSLHLSYLPPPFLGLLILTLLIVVAAFVGLKLQWSEQWESAHIALQATGPFLHIGAVAGLTMLAWPVATCFYRISHAALRGVILVLYLGAMLALYLAPLGIDSPCFLEQSQLPPKPALFGHRGAPMVSPCPSASHQGRWVLKTAAAAAAADFHSLAFADGIPFLLHDETLLRTTNVQEVFPTHSHAKATAFNWTQLQQLDAGSWFLQHPFPTAWSLSEEGMAQARRQRIPSLRELLAEARRHQVSVMFDLLPLEDPHYERLVNITVETILQSGIDQQLILWLPNKFREEVRLWAPRFQHIYGPESLDNKTRRLPRVNLAYQKLSSTLIREYHRNNISVNLFVVNAPWLFSVLWCAGTSSVTTNACQVLQKMQHPLWLLVRPLGVSGGLLLCRLLPPAGSSSDVLLTKIHSLLSE
uniref:Glycerophosphodiester phosphodiesterase domain containing 2 n=1 Tax=Pseudonaja textilis TaxID=8673 RepID=A0A670YU53_PSETE